MNRKKLIIIGIVIVVSIIIYFIWKKKSSKKDSANTIYNINDVNNNSIEELAKSIDEQTLGMTKEIVESLKKDTKLTQEEKNMFLRVWKGVLYAKKDKNWDDKSKDVAKKKQILLGYGVKENEIDWFIKRTS